MRRVGITKVTRTNIRSKLRAANTSKIFLIIPLKATTRQNLRLLQVNSCSHLAKAGENGEGARSQ
jgi:hypothetical protein